MIRSRVAWVLAALLSVLPAIGLARAQSSQPVKAVLEDRFTVETPGGTGIIPIWTSQDWSSPRPLVTRAVIVVHGLSRVADQYAGHLRQARARAAVPEATTLLIAPQFLAGPDIAEHGLAPGHLRWRPHDWPEGAPALGPAPLSSFDVLDALLRHLADRSRFPALRHVVVAGHSAGGQLTQRYAIVGRGEAALAASGIALRHVIANPSSWLWFGNDRPDPAEPGACPGFNHWRYGPVNPPPYVREDVATLEKRYLAREAVYLLGEADRDPADTSLDRSCAAMTQGPNRFARGMQFLFNLELRQPNQVYHRLFIIPGVGHDGGRMLASRCGLAALFDTAGCVGLP